MGRKEDDDLLEAMQRHLKRFGEALALRPDLFGEGDETRPGRLAVRMAKESDGVVSARDLLDRVLESLCPLWEGGAGDGNMVYGDSFEHYQRGAVSERIVVPFHQAAQEMVYSLIEPLAWAGFEVSGLEALTPPADPAHAALFLDTGVLKLSNRTRHCQQRPNATGWSKSALWRLRSPTGWPNCCGTNSRFIRINCRSPASWKVEPAGLAAFICKDTRRKRKNSGTS